MVVVDSTNLCLARRDKDWLVWDLWWVLYLACSPLIAGRGHKGMNFDPMGNLRVSRAFTKHKSLQYLENWSLCVWEREGLCLWEKKFFLFVCKSERDCVSCVRCVCARVCARSTSRVGDKIFEEKKVLPWKCECVARNLWQNDSLRAANSRFYAAESTPEVILSPHQRAAHSHC